MASNSEGIRFLESTTNLKKVIKRVSGRTPSTEVARDISACLQQGRLFFDAATASPLQIRPLQLYYGMEGFAKAMVLARTLRSISTLVQSHGLSDVSDDATTIAGMKVKFLEAGIFQDFNDTVAQLGVLKYYDGSMPKQEAKPFESAIRVAGTETTLEELLRRIPSLQRSFRRTFGNDPLCWSVDINYNHGLVDLRIDDPILFAGKDGLRDIVAKWRAKFPWLNNWCFSHATLAWNNSVLIFTNREKPRSGELADENLIQANDGFSAKTNNESGVYWLDILPPLTGGVEGDRLAMIDKLNGVELPDSSIQFAAAFLLSSLARYRPQVWQHALSHSDTQNKVADDGALSLIEDFMESALNNFPTLVRQVIDPSV
ncbi:YaaC family protein [Bradyrhizobium sp. 199]|uniref:YaaC family protein n=1 Tax=Bradyrhizobium sp. 199 TaxID=2782664 RepID=UPI001FFB02F4|nr:YaaC family protein [Bradyrhizobium sp. 199]MCK1357359.1 hypothetical protein [Bradyrhizobium sp. 199]